MNITLKRGGAQEVKLALCLLRQGGSSLLAGNGGIQSRSLLGLGVVLVGTSRPVCFPQGVAVVLSYQETARLREE